MFHSKLGSKLNMISNKLKQIEEYMKFIQCQTKNRKSEKDMVENIEKKHNTN